ncbi:MAG: D-ribose pyranase [Ignavibacteria bacterium]|nr:D-ribose pyranase [Ignavibacteria bacterium]
MKKQGILNAHLSAVIAGIGHGDKLVICDSGYPIPHGSEIVDLALTRNIPRLIETVKVILEELKIEGVIVANEMEKKSPHILNELQQLIQDIPFKKIPHEEFKKFCREEQNITFVKTGEATPFANTILIAGVTF